MRLLFGPRRIAMTFKAPRPPGIRLGEVEGEAHDALRLGVEALDAAGATHWITYGTLLGLVREGRLLPHDDDIDIAVMSGADASRITAEMERRGLRRTLEEAGPDGVSKLKYALGPVVVDLFMVHDEGAAWADYCRLATRSLVRDTHPPVTVRRRQLDGLDLPVPGDAETYLVHLYGPGWRQPVTRWHWYLSPANSEVLAHWRDLPRLAERWLRWKIKG
jgi:hypothetical protein